MPSYLPIILITLLALITGIATTIAARDVIWNKNSSKRLKLTRPGYIFIAAMLLLVILPIVQYFAQDAIDKQKEETRKTEQAKQYAELRQEYEASVERMRGEYETGNTKTLTVIGQTLAKYGYQLDTTNRRLIKLMHDTGNVKVILPDQPILQVMSHNGPAIKFIKLEEGVNEFNITFESQDASSCFINIRLSAVVYDSIKSLDVYKGAIDSHFSDSSDCLAKGQAISWAFPIDNSNVTVNGLFVWVRGTYWDRAHIHSYTIDKVYFHRRSNNEFLSMGGSTRNEIVNLVLKNEK